MDPSIRSKIAERRTVHPIWTGDGVRSPSAVYHLLKYTSSTAGLRSAFWGGFSRQLQLLDLLEDEQR